MRRARHLELRLKPEAKIASAGHMTEALAYLLLAQLQNYGKTLETQSCCLQVETVILSQGIVMHCQG